MIQLSLLLVLVAGIAIIAGVYFVPSIKPIKIVLSVVALVILIEGAFLIWVHKAANTLPAGAQLIDRSQVSDKE